MEEKMRVLTENPRNAETPVEHLRSWITANVYFFDRNQGAIPEQPVSLSDWALSLEGEVENPLHITFAEMTRMPKAIVTNTMECSGNSRSLLAEKASGNPWTIGAVGNAVWGGIWLRDLLARAEPKDSASHVAFEGMEFEGSQSKVKFVRSIPIDKAMESTLLAYEMNGEPLPVKHGYPLRALALGWTGANCVKWLSRIVVMDRPFAGFFMDKVYRVFGKGEAPDAGKVVTSLPLKSIITQPLAGENLAAGPVTILGAAYAGEKDVKMVEVSVDGGRSWHAAEFIGPHEPYAWRQWQYVWVADRQGEYRIMARATDNRGKQQPMAAEWNTLGYGNDGVQEHAIAVSIV